jgi:hypothetical protein
MQAYEHEIKIKLSFHPKDFKFASQAKRKAFEEEIVNTVKSFLISYIGGNFVNKMEFDGEIVKKYGMRPRGILLKNIKDDLIYSVSDFYDVKVEEEEDVQQKKEG